MKKQSRLKWILFLITFFCGNSLSWGQLPHATADSLKQLRDLTVKKTPRGAGDYVRYCVFCHGPEGKGDGLNAFSLKTRPRDFTDTLAMRGKTPANLTGVIRTGGAVNNFSKDMPPWNSTLDSVQIDAIAHYIKYFSTNVSTQR
jgi:mono/diheme cytochrome c family protein